MIFRISDEYSNLINWINYQSKKKIKKTKFFKINLLT